jgi:hypothetical protein
MAGSFAGNFATVPFVDRPWTGSREMGPSAIKRGDLVCLLSRRLMLSAFPMGSIDFATCLAALSLESPPRIKQLTSWRGSSSRRYSSRNVRATDKPSSLCSKEIQCVSETAMGGFSVHLLRHC